MHALATDRAVLRQVVRDLPEGERRSVVRDVMEYAAFVQEEGQGQGEFAAFLAQQFHEMEPLREPFARVRLQLFYTVEPSQLKPTRNVYTLRVGTRETGGVAAPYEQTYGCMTCNELLRILRYSTHAANSAWLWRGVGAIRTGKREGEELQQNRQGVQRARETRLAVAEQARRDQLGPEVREQEDLTRGGGEPGERQRENAAYEQARIAALPSHERLQELRDQTEALHGKVQTLGAELQATRAGIDRLVGPDGLPRGLEELQGAQTSLHQDMTMLEGHLAADPPADTRQAALQAYAQQRLAQLTAARSQQHVRETAQALQDAPQQLRPVTEMTQQAHEQLEAAELLAYGATDRVTELEAMLQSNDPELVTGAQQLLPAARADEQAAHAHLTQLRQEVRRVEALGERGQQTLQELATEAPGMAYEAEVLLHQADANLQEAESKP